MNLYTCSDVDSCNQTNAVCEYSYEVTTSMRYRSVRIIIIMKVMMVCPKILDSFITYQEQKYTDVLKLI